MWCVKCDKDLADCICPDIDERLAKLSEHQNLGLTFCSGCGAYYSRCKCPEPKPDVETRSAEGIINSQPAPRKPR